jgi:broad specificity phosphatase PhoE
MFTSPLRRAAETAEILAHSCGYPGEPEALENLQELDTGIFSAYTFGELPETFPEEWKRFRKDSWEAVPEAERIESLYRRALAVWSHLVETAEAGYRRIVCVTHGGILQWIFRASFGSASVGWLPFVKASNGGIFHFSVHPIYLSPGERLNDAFFSEWRLVNHRPGLDAPVEEYSSHLGPKG